MTGENGTPETPDWHVQHVIHVTREEFDWIMSDDPDHPWTRHSEAGLRKLLRDTMPPTIVLGDN